jgi:hypothetical protein
VDGGFLALPPVPRNAAAHRVGTGMIFLMFLWLSYRPLPPELPWTPEIEMECARGLHVHQCIEFPDGNLVWCRDMGAEEMP